MKRLGWILLLMACSCRSGCSGCSGSKEQAPALRTIAQLVTVRGEVKVRRAGERAWLSARAGLPLHPGDMVKTSEHASAQIAFTGGGALDVEEISLIVVGAAAGPGKPSPEPPRIARVESGSIRGVSQPGAPPLKVVTADGQSASIVADGKEPVPFRVRVGAQQKLEVAVLKGQARVEAGGSAGTETETVQVGSNQVVDITRQRISRPVRLLAFPELEAPGVDASFKEGGPILLRWSPVEGAASYRLQISNSTSFETRLLDTRTRRTEWSLSRLKVGKPHVWRVAALDAAGHESEFGFARRFYVLAAEASAKSSEQEEPPKTEPPKTEPPKTEPHKEDPSAKAAAPAVKVPRSIRWK